jgi:Na+/H+ antiporter NhaD/arsenite permease-like protein
MFSNIGGAATAIGDPPNVLIASDIGMQEAGVTFLNFTMHMTLCVILVGIVSAFYFRLIFRNLEEDKSDRELHDLKHEIIIWNRTLQGDHRYEDR